jgi:hypothetical protein
VSKSVDISEETCRNSATSNVVAESLSQRQSEAFSNVMETISYCQNKFSRAYIVENTNVASSCEN